MDGKLSRCTHVACAFPDSLVLSPISRWPTTLPEATVQAVMERPLPMTQAAGIVPDGDPCKSVTIIIVTFNSLVYTRMSLESVLANTLYPNYDVLVVDNGSKDGTPEYLSEVRRRIPGVRTIFNDRNAGFAAANNQALAEARGECLVLLNNDTLTPPGWLQGLLRYLEDPRVGLVGPVTNRTGNEAEIEVPYRTYGEFERFAGEYTCAHQGESFDIRMLAMFCVAMRRDVCECVGPLDERFQIGMLEDDDYAMRVRARGYRVACAEDVFVHHFGQASIGALAVEGEYGTLFHENRRRWEEKWGASWRPYQYRSKPRYDKLVERIRLAVQLVLPPGATVLVASKGDEELVRLGDRQAWHCPRGSEGGYAGHNPANSAEAIDHLEEMKAKGAEFFLLPNTSLWWLEFYDDFARHLQRRYRLVHDDKEVCLIFALREPPAKA